jgi:hypothetical protein
MTTTMNYNLQQINDISFSGFEFTIPEETLKIINYLCSEVGSLPITKASFQKKEQQIDSSNDNSSFGLGGAGSGFKFGNKKRKGNKNMEVSSEEWETLRTFQTTKIEQKTGLDAEIDQIRLLLNKLTDKTFLDMREKIIEKLEFITNACFSEQDYERVSFMIYDLLSSNMFYSKIYADLYAELLYKFIWLRHVFDTNLENILDQYRNIQYVEPDKDYDKFCDMNRVNEKRKAHTTFLVNLGNNGFIHKHVVVNILVHLINMVLEMVHQKDKKNEVDELTENIAILFNRELINALEKEDDYDEDNYMINDETILDTITYLAKCKSKDFVSLSNKAIFKYMDLVEM